jgi:hypothetical protein
MTAVRVYYKCASILCCATRKNKRCGYCARRQTWPQMVFWGRCGSETRCGVRKNKSRTEVPAKNLWWRGISVEIKRTGIWLEALWTINKKRSVMAQILVPFGCYTLSRSIMFSVKTGSRAKGYSSINVLATQNKIVFFCGVWNRNK